MTAVQQVYARIEHGGYPVHLLGDKLQITWPDGPQIYTSARQAILALTNPLGKRDPKIGFDRYFRRGRYLRSREPEPERDIIQLLLDPPNQVSIGKPKVKVDASLTVHIPSGIDLMRRGIEVRKIFFAGFSRKVTAAGYDPEDVLQDLYQGILVRNKGKCPFDPKKSSFAHYVTMIAECIWSNYKRRYNRVQRNESYGTLGGDGEEIDVAAADLMKVDAVQDTKIGSERLLADIRRSILQQAESEGRIVSVVSGCLDSIAVGSRPQEMANELGLDPRIVSSTISFIRRHVAKTYRQ